MGVQDRSIGAPWKHWGAPKTHSESTMEAHWESIKVSWKHYGSSIEFQWGSTMEAHTPPCTHHGTTTEPTWMFIHHHESRHVEVREGTRATIEVHHFFSNSTPHFGSLRPLPQTDLEKNKAATGCKIPWPRCTARTLQEKWRIFDDSGLRSVLSHSENISDEN